MKFQGTGKRFHNPVAANTNDLTQRRKACKDEHAELCVRLSASEKGKAIE